MSNQIRRDLGRVLLSPASFRRFFRQDPVIVAGKLAYGLGAAAVILSWTGYLYWLPDRSYHRYENFKARRERLESITADFEMLEREIDSIRAKRLHSRFFSSCWAVCREFDSIRAKQLHSREIDSIKGKQLHSRV